MDNKIKVYIKVGKNNAITHIQSSVFLKDAIGWIKVDEGGGDKYAYPQNYYLEKTLYVDMIPRYKYIDGAIVERAQEEIEMDKVTPAKVPTTAEYLLELECRTSKLEMGVK